MERGETKLLTTLIVTGSSTAVDPLGRVSIVLETTTGSIAFLVDAQAIQALRAELATAEAFLGQAIGRS